MSELRHRCGKCDFPDIPLGKTKCPKCGTPVTGILATDNADQVRQPRPLRPLGTHSKRGKTRKTQRPKAQKKPKRKKSGTAVLAASNNGSATMWQLQNYHGENINVSFEYELEDGSKLSPNYVVGKSLVYNLETTGDRTIARPVHNMELQRCIDRSQARGSKEILTHKRVKELGQTADLLKPDQSLPERLEIIKILEEKQDDPEAWAELAHGFKIPGLKNPLQKAVQHVGWEKFKLLQEIEEEESGSWPQEFLEYLVQLERSERERAAPSKVRRQRKTGDYGFDDTG